MLLIQIIIWHLVEKRADLLRSAEMCALPWQPAPSLTEGSRITLNQMKCRADDFLLVIPEFDSENLLFVAKLFPNILSVTGLFVTGEDTRPEYESKNIQWNNWWQAPYGGIFFGKFKRLLTLDWPESLPPKFRHRPSGF